MFRILTIALVGLSLASAAEARNRLAPNGALVLFETKTDDNFRVLGRAGFGPRDYYCAAGYFARVTLRARPTDRVVLTRPPTRSDRTVGFELVRNPAKQPFLNRDVVLRLREPGQSRTVGHARNLCEQFRFGINNND
ncbi:MAG: hypothetical protein AAFQ66_02505 [Pseudomonadota bacterium]